MKKVTILMSLVMFLGGCVFGGGGTTLKNLNVRWIHVSPDEILPLNLTQSGNGGITIKKEYSYTHNGGDINWVEVIADVDGDESGDFEFQVLSVNPYERTANNKILLIPEKEEKGTIAVSSEGQEVIVEFEIFPSGRIADIISPITKVPVMFNFATGEHSKEYGHIGAVSRTENKLRAEVVILDADDFWEPFVSLNNLQEYEYEEMEFEGSFEKVYLIKCGDDGYAAMRFTTRSGGGWGFIYKYSETGVFE